MTPTNKQGQSSLLGDGAKMCEFCKIIKKEAEAYVIFEDESTLAFLDMRPLLPGHILLVPKTHYTMLGEVPEETAAILFNNIKKLSTALENGLHNDGTFIAINNKVSQSIPHIHVHIVPRRFKDGFRGSFWPRYTYKSKEEISQIQESIIKALQK